MQFYFQSRRNQNQRINNPKFAVFANPNNLSHEKQSSNRAEKSKVQSYPILSQSHHRILHGIEFSMERKKEQQRRRSPRGGRTPCEAWRGRSGARRRCPPPSPPPSSRSPAAAPPATPPPSSSRTWSSPSAPPPPPPPPPPPSPNPSPTNRRRKKLTRRRRRKRENAGGVRRRKQPWSSSSTSLYIHTRRDWSVWFEKSRKEIVGCENSYGLEII